MNDANESMIFMSVGDSLDAALDAKSDRTEFARLDSVLAGKEAAGAVEAHNDSASAHPDIRNELKEKLEASDLSCHNTNATAHTDIQTRLDGKVDKAAGMGLSSNDFTASEKADVAMNTGMRHSHENKAVLDGITAALADGWCNAVAHIYDTVKHITAAERTSWNGKADKIYVDSSLAVKANVSQLSNPNLLDNWDFRNPVNQRGQTSYSGNAYGLDRWCNYYTVTTVNNGYVTIAKNALTGSQNIHQKIENPKELAGKEVTLSFEADIVANGYQVRLGYFVGDNADYTNVLYITETGHKIYSATFTLPTQMSNLAIFISLNGVAEELTTVKLYRAKLEFGGVSTLANDPPPNPQQELAKCQRYGFTAAPGFDIRAVGYDANRLYFCVPVPVLLRTLPVTTKNKIYIAAITNGSKAIEGFTFTIKNNGSLGFNIVANKANHGLNANDVILVLKDEYFSCDL